MARSAVPPAPPERPAGHGQSKAKIWLETHRPEAVAGVAGALVLAVILRNRSKASASTGGTAAVNPATGQPTATTTIEPASTYPQGTQGADNFEDQLTALNQEIAKVAAEIPSPSTALPAPPPQTTTPPVSTVPTPTPVSTPAPNAIPTLAPSVHPLGAIVAELPTAGNLGAYYLDSLGDVYTAGDAPFYGAYGSLPPSGRQGSRSFVGIAAAPQGGYTLEGNDGSQYTFGPGPGEWDVWTQ